MTAGICFPNLAYVPAKRLYNRLKEKYLPKQSAITTEKKLSDGRQDNEIVIQPDPGQNNPKDTDMYTVDETNKLIVIMSVGVVRCVCFYMRNTVSSATMS